MIAISSHRPLDQEPEIKRNQLLAKRTWESVFSRIIYFGVFEQELASSKTVFFPHEEFPRIKDLMEQAGKQRGLVAILNADIVVTPDLKKLERMMMLRGKLCASSRRYHFDPDTCDWKAAQLGNDRGRDIFIARNDIWRDAAHNVPEQFRIGHQGFDGWITDFFRGKYNTSFIDFTDMRIIFHPNHGNRKMPHSKEVAAVAGIH